MARLRVLVGAILAAALVLAFAAPASATGGGTAKVRAFHNSPGHPGGRHLRQRRQDPVGRDLRHPQRLPRGAQGDLQRPGKVAPSTDRATYALEADAPRRPTTIAAIGSLTGDGGALQLKVLRDRPSPAT